MPTSRQFAESPLPQGVDEIVVYTFSTIPWGTLAPSGPVAVAKDVTQDNLDVTTTVMPGSASAAADLITLPALKTLVEGHRYRIEVKFVAGSSTLEAFFYVEAEL